MYKRQELTVTEKDGKVYVAMSDKLLFESGSARVDKRGKEALAKLAEVLNKQSDIDVYIEGHTDSKPINTAQFKDNWDLSVICLLYTSYLRTHRECILFICGCFILICFHPHRAYQQKPGKNNHPFLHIVYVLS